MDSSILVQGTPEWFAARNGRFTSSETYKLFVKPKTVKDREAGLLSETTKGYLREKINERLTGQSSKEFTSSHTDWGHQYEPVARERYMYETGIFVEETGFIQYGNNAGGSPDALAGADGILEIKCPSANYVHMVFEEPVNNRNYYIQIQSNLLFTGREWCDYVIYDPRMPKGFDLYIQRILVDKPLVSEIRDKINWAEKELEKLEEEFKNRITDSLKHMK